LQVASVERYRSLWSAILEMQYLLLIWVYYDS